MKGVSPHETNGPIGRQAADEPEAQAVIRRRGRRTSSAGRRTWSAWRSSNLRGFLDLFFFV